MPKTAGIILVGNEILSGKIQDTNAHYLCRQLRSLGVDVRRIDVIPDEVDVIATHVGRASAEFDVVFTSGGVGPTHDDVTIEGVARAMRVPVIRHPALVDLLEQHYGSSMDEAYLKMTEVPDGADLITSDSVRFPTIHVRNVYILPGIPEIFRRKFDAIRERFRDRPIHLRNVFVRVGEGTIAAHMNALVREFPDLAVGSYPELSNPEYRVKVTLESRDRDCVEQALAAFVRRLPGDAVVRVGETE